MRPYFFLHNPLAFLPFALFVVLALMGCPPPKPPASCSNFVQQQVAYPGSIYSYGAKVQINADEYSSTILRPGDTITLNFDCTPVLAQNPTPGATVAIAGKTAKITMSQSFSASVVIDFSTPNCSFRIDKGNVWPGDANADGRRNMHDLMPICYAIANFITLDTAPPSRLQYPPVPSEMHQLRMIPESRKTLQIGGKTINLVHADCNLDGNIDTKDIAYLMAVLTPALPPNCLVDQMQGLELEASMVGSPVIVLAKGQFGLRIPFEIKSNLGSQAQAIFGISFTRSLTEMAGIKVAETEFVCQQGDVFADKEGIRFIRQQRFWDDIDVAIEDRACISNIDKPLDVAMFALNGQSVSINGSERIGNCNITLLDVMRTASPTGQIPLQFQHITGANAYTFNPNQGLTAHAISCSIDSAPMDLRVRCESRELILRDGDADDGLMPNAKPEHAFISPDIWLRHSQDGLPGHQAMKWGAKNWLYARVFNKSCDTLYNVTVDMRYCAANSSEKFPSDFSSIGLVSIPKVAPWGSAIGSIMWIAPGLPAGLDGIPVPTFVGRTSLATAFSGPLLEGVLRQNAMAARSSFMLDGGSVSNPAMARIELRLPTGNFDKSIVVEQVDGPLDYPASNYGSFELLDADSTFSVPGVTGTPPLPSSTISMTSAGTNTWPFTLTPGATSGAIGWYMGVPKGTLGIRFRANNTQPNFSKPVHYRFRVYMTYYTNGSLTIHNSSIFELTIP